MTTIAEDVRTMAARVLGAPHDIDSAEAEEYITRGVGRAYGNARSRFWQGFGGQVMRGERGATEVIAGMSGFAKPSEGIFGGAASIRDKTHARQILSEGTTIRAGFKRAPGQFARHAKLGAKTMGGLAVPIDIALRVGLMGESAGRATLRAAGGGVTGAIGAAVAGGIAGSIVPGLGTIAGFVGGIAAYGLGEAGVNVGLQGYDFLDNLGRRARRTELGGRVSAANMTRGAYTMRARALQQINRSGQNARSLLGRESQMLHM